MSNSPKATKPLYRRPLRNARESDESEKADDARLRAELELQSKDDLIDFALVLRRLSQKYFRLVLEATNLRRKGPEVRKARDSDGKQAAILKSKALWEEREAGKHRKLVTEDQFAMEVMRRYPELKSIASIKKRSTRWRNEARTKEIRK